MAITANELNSLVTRQDLMEIFHKIEQRFDRVQEEFKATRRHFERTENVRENQPEFVSANEFARLVGRTGRTIRNWVELGLIKASQPQGKGTSWIIPLSELDKVREMCDL